MLIRRSLALQLCAVLVLSASTVSFGQDSPVTPTSIHIAGADVMLIHTIDASAQADGLIREILVKEGQTIMPQQKVVKIDSRLAEAEVATARTELDAAEKKANQTAEMEFAKASDAVAQAEMGDMRSLARDGAASMAQVRRATLEATKTMLGVKVAEVKREQDKMGVEVAKVKLQAAEVRVELYTMLSPMEGVVSERLRDVGEWIRAGEPVFKLVHMNELKVVANVPIYTDPASRASVKFGSGPSADNGAITSPVDLLGAKMKVVIGVGPDRVYTYETEVEYVNSAVGYSDVQVWAKIPNQRFPPNTGPWLLRDGMKANVEIIFP